jgi:hypothetical protein
MYEDNKKRYDDPLVMPVRVTDIVKLERWQTILNVH